MGGNVFQMRVPLPGLCAGRAFLIPKHLPIETLDFPAKQYNSWLWGTKKQFCFLSNTEGIQNNSEEFRRNSDRIRQYLDFLDRILMFLDRIQTEFGSFQTEFRSFQTKFRRNLGDFRCFKINSSIFRQNLNEIWTEFRQNLEAIQNNLDEIQTKI